MNNSNNVPPAILLICISIAYSTGFVGGCYTGKSEMKRQAIQHGYAEYNAQTGQWQWKGEEKQ